MIKLIVSDMDGTLLNKNHELPKEFMQVFDLLQERKIYFCVASGRQYLSLLYYFEPIKNQIGFISENGAFVQINGKVVYESSIIPYHINQVLALWEKFPQLAIGLCGKEATYLLPTTPYAEEQVNIYHTKVVNIKDFSQIEDTIFQMTLFDPIGAKNHSFPTFSKLSQEGLKVTLSGVNWIDITNEGVNKGIAVNALQKELTISPEQTMVFGDYMNDLEMLRRATYSYAMKNAEPEVKEVASYVTEEDNDNNGVLKTIIEKLKISLVS
ncbi:MULTISPECIES: HAD family hydrolase [unclassified Capnocytophaga]|jgi:cof-like hydrolase|uniref:HAD family hydrolase n=1 Tax=unclassified Capnocytophaga TaxID=2640652 RepID=UPI000202F48C|nr:MULTISPECIES: HAD family hydrolase [unclassified Capnocytophaga]EGD35391.1 sugar-phosphatase [Capnocytophaga sp. oral taxon 338 str. F0234]MEB3005877.1 HAD family hydrolase [Capnocytophaga sp. G2]